MSDFVAEQATAEGRRPLAVDVFRPAQPNGVAVILLHGGGWMQGNRVMVHGYAKDLAQRGFVAVAAEYRLLSEAPWPSQLEDVRDVVRWTKANAARLGVDPTKIALQGYSAGGHLALMVAGTQPGSGHETAVGADPAGTEVAAVVSFFAPTRLDNPALVNNPPFSILLNGGGLEAARAASPFYYVNANFPTTFIIGGMADYMQPLQPGLDLLNQFVQAGAEVEFHYLHSQKHEFPSTPAMLSETMSEVAFFYRRTLIDRDAILEEARALNPFARASNMQEFTQIMAAGRPA